MKKLFKSLSLMLVVVFGLALITPVTALAAKKTHYFMIDEKYYYNTPIYDDNWNITGEKLKLSSEFKYTYDKNGNNTKFEYISYYSEKPTKDVTNYTYKNKRLVKATNSDGSYRIYAYKGKNLDTIKRYTKAKKLDTVTKYTYKNGKIAKTVETKGKKKLGEVIYKKGIRFTSKSWDEKGNLIISYNYDSHGNTTKSIYINYENNKKTSQSTDIYKNTYKKGKLYKVVEEDTYKSDNYTSKSKTETIYNISGKAVNHVAKRTRYSFKDGKYVKDEVVKYTYKFDKHNNVIESVGKNVMTKKVSDKTTYKYKAIKY